MKKKFRLNLLSEETENQEQSTLDNLKITRLKKLMAANIRGGHGIFHQFGQWIKGAGFSKTTTTYNKIGTAYNKCID